MKKYLSIGLWLILMIISCNNESELKMENEEQLVKSWRLVDITYETAESEKSNNRSQGITYDYTKKDIDLNLFPDGKMSRLEDSRYKVGTWKYKPSNQLLTIISDNKTENYTISTFIKKGKQHIKLKESSGKISHFKENGIGLLNFKEDPYYPDNNVWRIKPIKREKEEALKRRLQNYVEHYMYIFKASIARSSSTLSTKNSKGIIQFYKKAIGFCKIEAIPEQWLDCFYEDREAEKAHQYFKEYMDNKIQIKNSDALWIEVDYKILRELNQKIKADLEQFNIK